MQLSNSGLRTRKWDCINGAVAARQQQGAALILSLIILLVLSVIGLSSMNTSMLQERMSANAQNAQQAFFAAEAAGQDYSRKLEPMNSTADEWKHVLTVMDDGIREATTPVGYTKLGSAKEATAELRYLGEARAEGFSLGEDIETFRHRYEIIGNATITGTGAQSTVIRGVTVVFY